ncbi:MAG TPA: S4 domain-containing protein, partial [Sphingomicrobium sp.]|nr:S4 domain-containing protein [Sphingomicrobium sp.]
MPGAGAAGAARVPTSGRSALTPSPSSRSSSRNEGHCEERSDEAIQRGEAGVLRSARNDGIVRIDRYLFFIRLAKSRTLAQGIIDEGYVRIDGRRV